MSERTSGPAAFAPRPGAAPLPRMVRAQASMEARLLLRTPAELSDGQRMDVPLAQVARVGYRRRANEPDEPPAD